MPHNSNKTTLLNFPYNSTSKLLCGLLLITSLWLAFPGSPAQMRLQNNQTADGNISVGVAALQKAERAMTLPSKQYGIALGSLEISHRLSTFNRQAHRPSASHEIGVVRPISISSNESGQLFRNADNSKIRIFSIQSPGAVGLRIHFINFNLPPGEEIYVYGLTDDSPVAGPYTGTGPFTATTFPKTQGKKPSGSFWSDTIPGDTVLVEHYSWGEGGSFDITEVAHNYAAFLGAPEDTSQLSCHNDANCTSDTLNDAAARITFIKDNSSFVCSGTMLNNQVNGQSNNFSPYFLTANHCVSTQGVAETVQVRWFFRSTACNSGVAGAGVSSPTGARVLNTEQSSDQTLLRILRGSPGGLTYSGWTDAVQSSNTAIFGLHHPAGSFLRRSSGTITSTTTGCEATSLVNGFLVDWSSGITEGGSSGSGLFDSSTRRLIGVDSCGNSKSAGCDAIAIYGRFSDFFPDISTYLSRGDYGVTPVPAPAASPNFSMNGTLSTSNPASRVQGVGWYGLPLNFNGTAGQQVRITLSSTAFDTYLILLSPHDRELLAVNDDGGGGTNSLITLTLPETGEYIVEATSFFAGETGAFQLQVSTQQPCGYALSPGNRNFSASGGDNTVSVTAPAGCTWSVSSDVSWITFSPGSGSGNGTISYTVAANVLTNSRVGNITIAGQRHQVTQDGTACGYSIAPPARDFAASGGTGTVAVTTAAGCGWSAGSNASWISITSGSNGTGSGTVGYSVQANSGPSIRTSTLTIAGQTHTVRQDGTSPCVRAALPTDASGGSGSSITIPLSVGSLTGLNVTAYQFTLNYNSSVLQSPTFSLGGTLSSNFNVQANTSTAEQLRIVAFGTSALSGSGTLLNLRFNVIGGAGATSALALTGFVFNEGTPCANAVNGQFTVTSTGRIEGTISYAIGTPRGVAGVTVMGAGAPNRTASTDGAGNYALTELGGGAYTITPSRSGNVNGISAFDASLVAQCVATLRTCSAAEQLAGDASNNGSLSAFDASLIAQYVAGIANAGSVAGTWKFTPTNRTYGSTSGTQTGQHYGAVMVGDVSGNWAATTNAAVAEASYQPDFKAASRAPVNLALAPAHLTPGGWTMPVLVEDLTGKQVKSYEFDLLYDPQAVRWRTPAILTEGTLSRSATVIVNAAEPGRLRVAAFGTEALAGRGALLRLNLEPVSTATTKASETAGLALQRFQFNEGFPLTRPARNVIHLSAAHFREGGLSAESLAVAFGKNLALATEQATSLPLPTELAGTRVRVRDSAGVERLAPLLFVSPWQINYQVPADSALGVATVLITAGATQVSAELIQLESFAPGLFTANADGQGAPAAVVLHVHADGTHRYVPAAVFDAPQNRLVPAPTELGRESEQVYLLLFGTGLRHRPDKAALYASLSGERWPVAYAGPQGALAGVDQINLPLPSHWRGRGEVELWFELAGRTTNAVKLNLK